MHGRAPLVLAMLVATILGSAPGTAELKYCQNAKSEEDCEAAVRKALVPSGALATVLSAEEAESLVSNLRQEGQGMMEQGAAKNLLEKVAPEITALPGASAAFEDFLARLKIGTSSEGLDDMQALALDLTGFLGLPVKSGYKVQALAKEAALFEDLSKKLSVENREKRTKGLGDFDDLLVTFSFSPSTSRLGRNLGANQILTDELFGRFLAEGDALAVEAGDAAVKVGRLAQPLLLREDSRAAFSGDEVIDFGQIQDPSLRQQYQEAVETAAVAEYSHLANLSKTLKQAEFFKLADLVANQPQLVLKATRSVRNELVGPEETTLKVSYEMGFVNMNSLRRALSACKPTEMTTCYTSYLTDNRAALAKDGYRLTFSLDWTKREDYNLAIDNVSVKDPGRDRWCVSTTYGRNLRVDENGKFTSRIDLTGSWQDWSDDPTHQDRALANLSLTQKVSDDFSLVLGAVWASKPEFRGQVDKEVSARFGLTYRFLDKEGKEIMRGN